jgi:hypothetical protein
MGKTHNKKYFTNTSFYQIFIISQIKVSCLKGFLLHLSYDLPNFYIISDILKWKVIQLLVNIEEFELMIRHHAMEMYI